MTDGAKLYLKFLERYGAGLSDARLCKMYGCAYNTLGRWRQEEEFRVREREIRDAHALTLSGPGYTNELDRWIEAYSEHKDRQRACEETGTGWGMVEIALQECLPFRVAYTFYSENRLLSEVEDRLVESAVAGHSKSVDMLLKSRHPDYLPTSRQMVDQKVNVTVTHELVAEKKQWLAEMTSRHLPAADTIDAELVTEGGSDGSGNEEEPSDDVHEQVVSG